MKFDYGCFKRVPSPYSKFKWMSTFRTYTGRPRIGTRHCWAGALTDIKLKQTSWMKWTWLAFPWTWIVLIVACELGQMVPIRGVVGRTEGRIIKSFVSIRTPIIVTSASQDRASRYYHIAEDCKHTLQIPLYISSKEVNTNFTKKYSWMQNRYTFKAQNVPSAVTRISLCFLW